MIDTQTSQSVESLEAEVQYTEDELDLNLLIEIIQSYEYLYNLSDKRYKDQKKKARAWEEISEILKCPGMYFFIFLLCIYLYIYIYIFLVETCQRAWKSLRDKFVKERNKQKASGSCPSENIWPFFDKMMFYSKFNKPRR